MPPAKSPYRFALGERNGSESCIIQSTLAIEWSNVHPDLEAILQGLPVNDLYDFSLGTGGRFYVKYKANGKERRKLSKGLWIEIKQRHQDTLDRLTFGHDGQHWGVMAETTRDDKPVKNQPFSQASEGFRNSLRGLTKGSSDFDQVKFAALGDSSHWALNVNKVVRYCGPRDFNKALREANEDGKDVLSVVFSRLNNEWLVIMEDGTIEHNLTGESSKLVAKHMQRQNSLCTVSPIIPRRPPPPPVQVPAPAPASGSTSKAKNKTGPKTKTKAQATVQPPASSNPRPPRAVPPAPAPAPPPPVPPPVQPPPPPITRPIPAPQPPLPAPAPPRPSRALFATLATRPPAAPNPLTAAPTRPALTTAAPSQSNPPSQPAPPTYTPYSSYSIPRTPAAPTPASLRLLDKNHPEHIKVESQFHAGWKHAHKRPQKIERLYAIDLPSELARPYNAYKASLERSGYYNCEKLYFHGTRRACDIGEPLGSSKPCSWSYCSVCSILTTSFKVDKAGSAGRSFARFGPGVYTTSVSSKADDYNGYSELKAMFVVRVAVGNGYPLYSTTTTLTGPPPGYHCVLGMVGQDLNYDEQVFYDDDAIRPAYLILYRPKPQEEAPKSSGSSCVIM